jgi:protein-disulfide isomerase
MTRFPVRLIALSALLLPLGLAACKKDDAGSGAASSTAALAKVPPPAGKAWSDVLSVTADGGHLMGNPDAPIKLLEYGSLSCPHCAHLSQQANPALVDDFVNSGRVSYEFRSFSIHPQDVPLTVMVECAPPESFFPLVAQIYANFDAMNAPLEDKATLAKAQAAMTLAPAQRWPAFADAAGYTAFFAQRGLPTDKVHACLADVTKAKAVADRAQKYGDAGIDQTPTIVLNGNKLEIAEWSALKTALENAGAR